MFFYQILCLLLLLNNVEAISGRGRRTAIRGSQLDTSSVKFRQLMTGKSADKDSLESSDEGPSDSMEGTMEDDLSDLQSDDEMSAASGKKSKSKKKSSSSKAMAASSRKSSSNKQAKDAKKKKSRSKQVMSMFSSMDGELNGPLRADSGDEDMNTPFLSADEPLIDPVPTVSEIVTEAPTFAPTKDELGTDPPIQETDPPIEVTEPPIETDPPAEQTSTPVVETDPPLQETEATVPVATEAPVEDQSTAVPTDDLGEIEDMNTVAPTDTVAEEEGEAAMATSIPTEADAVTIDDGDEDLVTTTAVPTGSESQANTNTVIVESTMDFKFFEDVREPVAAEIDFLLSRTNKFFTDVLNSTFDSFGAFEADCKLENLALLCLCFSISSMDLTLVLQLI